MKPVIKKMMMTLTMKEYEILKKNKEKYQLFFEENPTLNIVIGEDYCIKEINKAFLKDLGYTKKDILGKKLFFFVEPSQRKPLKKIIEREFKEKLGVEALIRLVDKKGELHDVHFVESDKTPIYKAIDGTKAMLASGIDVTEKIMIEKELRKEKEFSEKILALSNAIIVGLDKDHRIFLFNKGAQKATGYSEKEVIGKNWFKIFFHKNQYEEMTKVWNDAWKVNIVKDYTNSIRTKKGEDIIVSWQNSKITSEDEKEDIVICVGKDITETRKQEETYRLLAENSIDCIWKLDARLRFTYISPSVKELFGYTPEEMIGKPLYKFSTKEEFGRMSALVMKIKRNPKKFLSVYFETIFINKEGTSIAVEVIGKPLFDKKRKMLSLQGSTRVITERKKAEVALEESNEKYGLLFSNMHGGFGLHEVVLDKKGKPIDYIFLDVNDSFERLTGLKKKNIIGKKITEVLPGIRKDPANWIEKYGNVVLSGKPERFESYSDILGRWYSISVYSPKKGLFATIFHDITEKKEAEKALKKNEQQLIDILDSTPFPVAIVGLEDENNISYWSKSAMELFGHTPSLVSDWFEKAYPNKQYRKEVIERWNPFVEKARKLKKVINAGEYDITCANGDVLTCEIHVNIIHENMVVTLNDITERKKFQDLIASEKEFNEETINSLPGVFYLFTKQGEFVRWNDDFSRVTGYRHSEIKKITPTDLFEGEDKENIAKAIKTAFTKGDVTVEASFHTKKGKKVPYYFTGKKVSLNDKQYLIGTGIDMTESKKNREELKESKEMLQRIIDLLPARIFWKDKELMYLGCNEAFAKDAGKKSPDEMIGKNDFDMAWKDQAKLYRVDDNRVITSKKPRIDFEEPQTSSKGNIWLRTSKMPLTDTAGKVKGILGTYTDITNIKKAEQALKESEEKFRLYIEKAPMMILVINEKAKIIDCNNTASLISGYAKKELLGMSVTSLASPENREGFTEEFKSIAKQGYLSKDYVIQRKNNEQIHVRVDAASLTSNKYIAFCLDINEQKKALSDVERFNEFAIGRELRMVELKKKIKELEEALGEKQ